MSLLKRLTDSPQEMRVWGIQGVFGLCFLSIALFVGYLSGVKGLDLFLLISLGVFGLVFLLWAGKGIIVLISNLKRRQDDQ